MALKPVNVYNDTADQRMARQKKAQELVGLVNTANKPDLKSFLDIYVKGSDDDTVTSLAVAAFDRNNLSMVMNESVRVISTIAQSFDKDIWKIDRLGHISKKDTELLYRDLQSTGFFKDIQKEDALGTISEYENVPGYQIHQSNRQAMVALDNIRNNNGRFIAFDLETTAGRDTGSNRLGGHITEFSFIDSSSGEDYTSIIGATPEEVTEYRDILRRYQAGTKTYENGKFVVQGLSDKELVTLTRLAKMGNRNTIIDESQISQGVISFSTFAGAEDVAYIDANDVISGINRMERWGIQQEQTGLNSKFEVKGEEFAVRGWEERLLEGLKPVLTEGVTLAGQNSRTFDLPHINRLISSNKVSEGFKDAIKRMTDGELYLDIQNHLDMLPLLRQFLTPDFYSQHDLDQLQKLGLSRNSLEAVARRLTAKPLTDEQGNILKDNKGDILRDWSQTAYEEGGAGAAHMAKTDVKVTIDAIRKTLLKKTDDSAIKLLRDRFVEAANDKSAEKDIGKGSVLFAREHFEPQNYDLIQLMEDNLTHELRTMDKISISNEEVKSQGFGQFGLQKGVLYEVQSVSSFKPSEEQQRALSRLYPSLELGKLSVIKMSALVRDDDYNIRAQSPIYYVGDQERLLHALRDHTFYIGEKEGTGKDWQVRAKMTPFVQQQLTRTYDDIEDRQETSRSLKNQAIEELRQHTEYQNLDLDTPYKNLTPEKKSLRDGFWAEVEERHDELLQQHFGDSIETIKKNLHGHRLKTESPIEDGYLSEKFIKDTSRRALDESVLRDIREHNYKKDAQVLRYLNLQDAIINDESNWGQFGIVAQDSDTQKKDKILSKFWQNAIDNNPIKISGKDESLRDIFGYSYDGQSGLIYSETLSKQVRKAQLDYFENNREIIDAALKAAKIKGSGDAAATDYYYKWIMKSLEHQVQETEGEKSESLGYRNTGLLNYEYDKKFEIDLSGFPDIKSGTIASINLEAQPEGIANTIIRAAKGTLGDLSDYTEAGKSMLLRRLQKFLTSAESGYRLPAIGWNKKGTLDAIKKQIEESGFSQNLIQEFESQIDSDIVNPNQISETDHLYVASQKFWNMLNNRRVEDPFAGHIKDTISQTTDISIKNYGLTERDSTFISQINEMLESAPTFSGIFTLDKANDAGVINKAVDQVMSEVIMPDEHDRQMESFIKNQLYIGKDAEALKFVRGQHREGVRQYTNMVFDMVGKLGGSILWNKNSRDIFAAFGGDYYKLELPVEEIINGQFHWRIGNQVLSQSIGFFESTTYGDRSKRKLMFGSRIGAIAAQNKGLVDWRVREAQTGYKSRQEAVQKSLSDINQILRESSTVDYATKKTAADQFRFDYEDVLKHIDQILSPMDLDNANGIIKTDPAFKQVLLDLISGKESFDAEHPEHRHILALDANIDSILKIASQRIETKADIRSELDGLILPNIDIDIKPLKKRRTGYFGTYIGDWYNLFNYARRDPSNIEDVLFIDANRILEQQRVFLSGNMGGSADYLSGTKDILVGKAMTNKSNYERATEDSVGGRNLQTHYRVKAIHMDSNALAAVMNANMKDAIAALEKKGDFAAIASAIHGTQKASTIEEGVSFIHGHVFDQLFSDRNSVQRINLNKVLDENNQRLLDIEHKVLLDMKVDKDGNFKYAKGIYVNEGDVLVHIPGFGSHPLSERAKYEGLLKFGFFDQETGQVVSEEAITKIIQEDLKQQRYVAENEETRARNILSLLQNKFMAAYYVQGVEANTLFKMNEFAEKSMTRALVNNTGSVDMRIAYVLEQLGFNAYTAKDGAVLKRLQTLEEKMIQSITEGKDSDFWQVAKGRYQKVYGKELTDKEISNILSESFNNSPEEFQAAIREERYGATRLMDQLLQQAEIIGTGESWHEISHLAEGHLKHNDLNSVRALLDETFYRERNKVLANIKIPELARASTNEYSDKIAEANRIAGERTRELFGKYFLNVGDTAEHFVTPKELESAISVDEKTGQLIINNDELPKLKISNEESFSGLVLDKENLDSWLREINVIDNNGNRTDQISIEYQREKDQAGNFTGNYLKANSGGDFTAHVSKSMVEISRNNKYWELGKDTEDAVKFNQRALTNLGNMRVDDKLKGDIKSFLEERSKNDTSTMEVLGEQISNSDIYEKLINPMEKGTIVQSAAYDQIRRQMFNRAGGGEKLSGFLQAGENGDLVWGINTEAITKFVQKHNVGGGNIEKGAQIMGAILNSFKNNMGITTVNEVGAENALNVVNALTAATFNQGQMSVADAEKVGFKTINIEDILAETQGAQHFQESLYSKNWIIDLDNPKLKGLITNGSSAISGRYIAIAATPMMEHTGEYIEDLPNKPQEKLKGLLTHLEEYKQASNETGFKPGQQQELQEKIRNDVEAIRAAQYNMWHSKTGVTAEATRAYMADASRNTSRGINLMGTEEAGIEEARNILAENGGLINMANIRRADISQLNVFGINLVEEAKKGNRGLALNYSILSTQRMHQVYDTNFAEFGKALEGIDGAETILSQLKQDTLNIVQTQGVSGISAREPLQYPTSVSQRQIFFNDIAQGNEVLSELTNAQMRKEDFDADAAVNSIHKEEAQIKIGNNRAVNISVDSAMYTAMKNLAAKNSDFHIKLLDEGAEQRFKNYAESQIYIGAGEGQRYRFLSTLADESNVIDDFANNHLLQNQMKDYLQSAGKGTGISLAGTKLENVLFKVHSTPAERKELSEALQDTFRDIYKGMLAEAYLDQEKYGEDFIFGTGEVQRVKLWQHLSDEEKTGIKGKAILFSMQDKYLAEDLISRSGFAPTGRVNRMIQSVYDITQAVANTKEGIQHFEKFFGDTSTGKDMGAIMEQLNLVGLMVQEGFMSPKNVEGGGSSKTAEQIQAEFVPRLEKSVRSAFALNNDASDARRREVRDQLESVITDIFNARFDARELTKNPMLETPLEAMQKTGNYNINFSKYIKEKVADGSSGSYLKEEGKKAIQTFADILAFGISYNNTGKSVFDLATSGAVKDASNLRITLASNSSHMPNQINEKMALNTLKYLGVHHSIDITTGPTARNPTETQEEIDRIQQQINDEMKQREVNVPKATQKPKVVRQTVVKMSHGNGLLGAAIGVAGGLMISGFAGNPANKSSRQYPPAQPWGNAPIPDSALPPAPIDQAADSSWMYGQQYPKTLSDSGMTMNSNTPIIGYNINISGMSPKGEAAAQRAIGAAVNYGVPQNSSINVAVHNNYQDTMSQYQVNRMVQTSLGF